MLLRRIYFIRRGLLARERMQILAQSGISHHQMPLPNENLARSSDLANQIENNAKDDYRVYYRVACALRRGVSTSVDLQ